MYRCFQCQAPWESSLRQPAVKETCAQCGAYLHCCRNCRFHTKGRPNECFIPDTEKIADKRRANFCDEFEFRQAAGPKRPAVDTGATTGPRGEAPERARGEDAQADLKDWLLQSDKPARGFDDLFDD